MSWIFLSQYRDTKAIFDLFCKIANFFFFRFRDVIHVLVLQYQRNRCVYSLRKNKDRPIKACVGRVLFYNRFHNTCVSFPMATQFGHNVRRGKCLVLTVVVLIWKKFPTASVRQVFPYRLSFSDRFTQKWRSFPYSKHCTPLVNIRETYEVCQIDVPSSTLYIHKHEYTLTSSTLGCWWRTGSARVSHHVFLCLSL